MPVSDCIKAIKGSHQTFLCHASGLDLQSLDIHTPAIVRMVLHPHRLLHVRLRHDQVTASRSRNVHRLLTGTSESSCFLVFTFAPRARRTRETSRCPFSDDWCSEVHLELFRESTSAPHSMSKCTSVSCFEYLRPTYILLGNYNLGFSMPRCYILR